MAPKCNFKIRDATTSDASEILKIYEPFITESIASFEYEVPSEQEMQRRIQHVQKQYPWLILEAEDGSIAGYAYGCTHRERLGYQWVTETGIYLAENSRGKGAGGILYKKLCEILKAQGYVHALAVISGDNVGSFEFHKKLGFQFSGMWKDVGSKFGKWWDVHWYRKQLNEIVDNPEPPRPYPEIKAQISLAI